MQNYGNEVEIFEGADIPDEFIKDTEDPIMRGADIAECIAALNERTWDTVAHSVTRHIKIESLLTRLPDSFSYYGALAMFAVPSAAASGTRCVESISNLPIVLPGLSWELADQPDNNYYELVTSAEPPYSLEQRLAHTTAPVSVLTTMLPMIGDGTGAAELFFELPGSYLPYGKDADGGASRIIHAAHLIGMQKIIQKLFVLPMSNNPGVVQWTGGRNHGVNYVDLDYSTESTLPDVPSTDDLIHAGAEDSGSGGTATGNVFDFEVQAYRNQRHVLKGDITCTRKWDDGTTTAYPDGTDAVRGGRPDTQGVYARVPTALTITLPYLATAYELPWERVARVDVVLCVQSGTTAPEPPGYYSAGESGPTYDPTIVGPFSPVPVTYDPYAYHGWRPCGFTTDKPQPLGRFMFHVGTLYEPLDVESCDIQMSATLTTDPNRHYELLDIFMDAAGLPGADSEAPAIYPALPAEFRLEYTGSADKLGAVVDSIHDRWSAADKGVTQYVRRFTAWARDGTSEVPPATITVPVNRAALISTLRNLKVSDMPTYYTFTSSMEIITEEDTTDSNWDYGPYEATGAVHACASSGMYVSLVPEVWIYFDFEHLPEPIAAGTPAPEETP